MTVKKVWLEGDCIGCGACEGICPDVFEMGDGSVEIIEDADFAANSDDIKEAAERCPVSIIKFEE